MSALFNSKSSARHMAFVAAGLTVIAMTGGSSACGMFAVRPEMVPVERLLQNSQEFIKENPKDYRGYYVAGRVHSIAFAFGTAELTVGNRSTKTGLHGFMPEESIMVRVKSENVTAERRRHLSKSIQNYRRATELAPKEEAALPFLGLGWMWEEASKVADELDRFPDEESDSKLSEADKSRIEKLIKQLGADKAMAREQAMRELRHAVPAAVSLIRASKDDKDAEIKRRVRVLLRNYAEARALDAYRQAFDLRIKQDQQSGRRGPAADSLISLEAGESILRIYDSHEATAKDLEQVERIQKAIAGMPKSFVITPIVFPLDCPRRYETLIANDSYVRFDFLGNKARDTWTWVQPTTGILVWDPNRSGRVKSGQQLFGTTTWWIIWRNGYEALASLDDNYDGRLTGSELDGLAVWQDRNSNGVSDPGEVVPISRLRIRRIAVQAKETNGILGNASGIEMDDATSLPTYDWIARKVVEEGRP